MPAFRFQSSEVAEMEAAAKQVTRSIFPSSEVIEALTARFNSAPARRGKYRVQSKQVYTSSFSSSHHRSVVRQNNSNHFASHESVFVTPRSVWGWGSIR